MIPKPDNVLIHYGIKRRSGRYPWGSGDNPYQHSGDFLSRVEELRKEKPTWTDPDTGKTYKGDTAVAHLMGMSTKAFRTQVGLAREERRQLQVDTAKGLKEKGYNNTEIARQMGLPGESSVRSLLKENSESRMKAASNTADFLREQVDKKGMIDVGSGVELQLRVSREKMDQALEMLKMEGYEVYGGRIEQVTNKGKMTTLKVLCQPGTEHREIFDRSGDIQSVEDYISHDGGETFSKFQYPASMDSKRLKIRYAGEEGGEKKDGVIEIRRGVADLSLGESHYSQVRILVDGTHYLKGMAVYSDNMPDGVDVIFNTNKASGTPVKDVLKKITDDPNNPFGSLIKERGGQSYYDDPNGKFTDPVTGKKQSLSLINKRADEGDWGEWSKELPSQFLSKQNYELMKKQLKLAEADKVSELDEIISLTQPTVKRALLESFANDCDSAAVHLKAAALPGQRYQVILPLTSVKDTEIYAPNFDPGEKVALIRYPHGGTFEIPILTVNNKITEGQTVIGNTSKDAVGISKAVADRLSGADFDGDTVMVIPLRGGLKVTSTPPLKGLEGFDPKIEYAYREGMTLMKREVIDEKTGAKKVIDNTQKEMGVISNLITDMTLRGAHEDELAAAVRHSMVVIDAGKHKLDYKRSEKENNIQHLKELYQRWTDEEGNEHVGGASTLISRAKSEVSVLKRQGSPRINPEDGSLIWKTADDVEYTDKRTGETEYRKQQSTAMMETKDARTLISNANTPAEQAYAEYANKMKALANQARKEMISTKETPFSASAKAVYQAEVQSLLDKLRDAETNRPRERQAQILANAEINAKKQSDPSFASNKKEVKKASQQALTRARLRVGAQRTPVEITDREWEAIQAGAVNKTTLRRIINHTDIDALRQRATPHTTTTLSQAQIGKIAAMKASGYTVSEIAKALGKSTSTVSKYL